MTSVDMFAIKEQIVSILKANTSLFTTTGATDKTVFRKIEAGLPTPKGMNEPPLPRLWVTSDDVALTASQFSHVSNNTSFATKYDVGIKIIFAVEKKGGPKTEEAIDDFTKIIIEVLQANYDLRDVGGSESTRLADSSEVTQVQNLNLFAGDAVQGRIIRFKVVTRK